VIRINRKCTCCDERNLIIIRGITACLICDRAANWEGVKVK